MRVGILSGFPFPFGYAGTNRVLSFCKGLSQSNIEVVNFIYKPTEIKGSNRNVKSFGFFEGVKFIYPIKTTFRKNNKLFNYLFKLLSIFKTIIYICRYNQKKAFNAIIIYNDYPFLLFLFTFLLKRFTKSKIIFAVDEYPPEMRSKDKESINYFSKLFYKLSFYNINGIISMTNELVLFYSRIIGRKNIPNKIIPISVDPDRFINISNEVHYPLNYISYIGNFDISKDGVDILIKAFSKVHQYYNDLYLLLAGVGSLNDMKKIRLLIKKYKLESKIILLGYMHRKDVPTFLHHSKVLCLPRPWTKRSSAGIPTKLGEYLISGKPTIITKVGELTDYLKDGHNCQIVEPDNIDAFAKRILFVLNNYKNSLIIAERGRDVALKVFNSSKQGKLLKEFIISLK